MTRQTPEIATESQRQILDISVVSNPNQQRVYKNYPAFEDRLPIDRLSYDAESRPIIPAGDWWVNPDDNYSLDSVETEDLRAKGVVRFDSNGRPLHPWFDNMVQNPDAKVACGKGAYWEWGPNQTADPIVFRYDLGEPHILLIQRKDTGEWALPGGFVDPGEMPALTALRETKEEAGLDLSGYLAQGLVTYQGAVADPRTTLHAWPETTAVRFDLPDEFAATLPTGAWQGGDDAKHATWAPMSWLTENLFGSHLSLVMQSIGTHQWKP